MTSKLFLKILKIILKSCFKFVFLTKKFKEMKQDYILKTFINGTTKNIKILLILLKFQNLWNLINVLI